MTNNTTANETTNQTADSGLLGGLTDGLGIEIIAIGALTLVLGTYIYFRVPSVRDPIMLAIAKLTNKHGEEIEALLKKHLGKAFDKMDDEVKKRVKNDVLKDVILTSFDHTEEKASGTVKKLVKDIAKNNK